MSIISLSLLYLPAQEICFVHGLPSTAKLQKHFCKNPIRLGEQCSQRVLWKGLGAYVGNEMLLVSDSKRPYQLSFPSFPPPLFFATTQRLQAALWEKFLSYSSFLLCLLIHRKTILSSLILCWVRLFSHKLCLWMDRYRLGSAVFFHNNSLLCLKQLICF